MSEELRFFLRPALYAAVVGTVYWFVSYEVAGTVLLAALVFGSFTFLGVAAAFVPSSLRGDPPGERERVGGPLGALNRVVGFHEHADAPQPLEGGPDLIPLSSAWPIVTAGAMVIVGLGLIFGAWLIVPGLILLALGGLGWLTQLDRR